MDDKLTEALNAVVTELRSLSPIEFHKAIEEASKSEFAQTINLLNNFTNHIINTRSTDDGDTLSLFLPIENKPSSYPQRLLIAIKDKEALSIKQPCLFPLDTNIPIEVLPVLSQTDGEEPPHIGLVSKTPYRDITPYREEWHINPIDK